MTMQRLKQQFGNYRLVSLLGRGDFSEVYLGEHVYLKTQAAIKILTMHLAQDELSRFLSEARIIAHLEHPHIVRVLDFGLEGNEPLLVLSYAQHGSMRQRYPRGSALPLENIMTYARQVASALQYAHAQELIHGDVKPENILIGRGEEMLLSDFGVAVVASHATPREDISGTVAYMAPEQLRGEPCFASDQYALGIVVYEWICGSRPFNGSFKEIALQHMQAAPPSLAERVPQLPPTIEQVVMKALAKDPQQRFTSVSNFVAELETTFQTGRVLTLQSGTLTAQPGAGESPPDDSIANQSGQYTRHALFWMPYHRNPYFTGRAALLDRLAAILRDGAAGSSQPLALSGMGGIGKTQLAIEYIYRYQSEYAVILWARADSHETLLADFAAIAQALQLTNALEMDRQQMAQAATRWLATERNWLLVLDNIEDFSLIQRFIPPDSQGPILLTTRSQATGTFARHLGLEKLTLEEGVQLLLCRSKQIAPGLSMTQVPEADKIEAQDICKLMDGLPLALDQAGAYIEESGCSLYHYIERYREQSAVLLRQRGEHSALHPQSVSATVLLALEKVEQDCSAAIDLLNLCAFLQADSIDEEIIADLLTLYANRDASNPDGLIAALRKYSLISRQSDERTLSLHRLVQAIVKDHLEPDKQRAWAERAVSAVSHVFPEADKVTTWSRCERLMPHVYACVRHIEQWQLVLPEAARLLDQAGIYLLQQGQYDQAIRLLSRAIEMRTTVEAPDSIAIAETMNSLASCYFAKAEYMQAEQLFVKVLAICERASGAVHSEVAVTLNNLALLYQQQGKYSEAERSLQRALAIWEQLQESGHPDLARTLNNLALLYHRQHRLSEAEPLYRRGLTIWESLRGPTHPDLAVHLNNLAILYQQQRQFARAEPLFRRVLDIREKTLGPEHPAVAYSLIYLAHSYQFQWKYAEAEVLFKQALKIRKRALGPEHPETAHSLCNLAKLYFSLGRHAQAESLYQQALKIREEVLGPEHPEVAALLKNYALLLMGMKRRDEALLLAARAKSIRAKQGALNDN